jgi:hypothetical protein
MAAAASLSSAAAVHHAAGQQIVSTKFIDTPRETASDPISDDDDLTLNFMGEAATLDYSDKFDEAGDPHLSDNIVLPLVGHPDRLLGCKRAKTLVLAEAQESSVKAKLKGLHDFQEQVIKESFEVAIQDFEDRFNNLKDNLQGYLQQLFCDHFANPKPSKKKKAFNEDTGFGDDDVRAPARTVTFEPLEREVSNDIIFDPLRDSPSYRDKFAKKEKKQNRKKTISNDYNRLQQTEKKEKSLLRLQEKAALKKAVYKNQKMLAPRSVFDEIVDVVAKPEQAKKKNAAAKTAAETRTAPIVAAGDSVAAAGDSAAPEANQERQLQEQEQEEKKNKEKQQAVSKKLQADKFDRHYNTAERIQSRKNDQNKRNKSHEQLDLSDDEDPEAVKAAAAATAAAAAAAARTAAAAASEAPGAVVAAAASTPAARFTASAAIRGKKEKATGAGAAATGAGAKKNNQAKSHELSCPEATEGQCSTCDVVLGKGHCPACYDRIDNPPALPSRQHTQRFDYQVVLYFQTLALSSHIHIIKVVV